MIRNLGDSKILKTIFSVQLGAGKKSGEEFGPGGYQIIGYQMLLPPPSLSGRIGDADPIHDLDHPYL